MTNQQKAKFIADQCMPCSGDFYSGIYQGVLLALDAENSKVAQKERNLEIVGRFVDYLKASLDIEIKEEVVVGFFEE